MNSLKKFDLSFLNRKVKFLAGVDEAGRGPLAGPVVAAAVIFDKGVFHEEINDSKKLSEKKREELALWISKNCVSYGLGISVNSVIDQINILQATLKAMKDASLKLSVKPDLILIDGNKSFATEAPTKTIVKGDAKSFSIAAASILAKVMRDKLMKDLSRVHPEYGWNRNKGYPTHEHIVAIKKHGVTLLHRKSFLKNILSDEQIKLQFGESDGGKRKQTQKGKSSRRTCS